MTTDARAMIERGYKIFPLRHGDNLTVREQKEPAVKWQDDVTFSVDEEQNYGINTGKSGLVVIDIDGEKGIESFERILGEKNWPDTFTVQTPRGGYHLYFRGDGYKNSASHVGRNIDVRGDGGYVVGPGSVVGGKTYEIVTASEPSEVPDWLRPRLNPDFTPVEAEALWAVESRVGPINGQDDQLSRDVWLWRRQGYDHDEAHEKWLNRVDELGGALDSSDPWTQQDFERHWKGADRKVTKLETAEAEEVRQAVGLFEYKKFGELDSTPFSYAIDGLLPTNCNVLFSAKAKAGKTSTSLNLARALTSNDDFLGEFRCPKISGNLVYVNFELDEVMLRQYGLEAGLDFDSTHLITLNLRGKARHFKILNEDFIDAWASELKKIDTEFLIVDPLSPIMAMNGFDSDDNDGARRVLESFGAIQNLAGIDNVLIIDHTGHEQVGRPRGASAKMDWPDVIWNQEKKNGDGTRTFSAEGRGVEERKFSITRNSATGMIETTIPVDADGGDERLILASIENSPGITYPELEIMTKIKETTLRRRVKSYIAENRVHEAAIPHTKAKGLYLSATGG